MIANVRAELAKQVLIQTEGVRNEVITLVLETPKTGRIYTRRTVEHQASAPGEPFANDTGDTINHLKGADGIDFTDGGLTGIVKGNENHARLEFGTRKMEPRPTMRPALANRKPNIEQGLAKAVKVGLAKK